MAIAQGTNKTIAYKKQSGLGVTASGAGQYLRRETANNNLTMASYSNSEIVRHQQDTGITNGLLSASVDVKGVVSPGTYKDLMASALRGTFTAITALTGLTFTIGGTAGAYTLTGTGWLANPGVKVGAVIRISGTGVNAADLNKNIIILAATATVITCTPVNGSTMTTGSVTAGGITWPGKKVVAPTSGHTFDYYTFEDWQNDISQSEAFTDVMIGGIDVGLPSTGNATIGVMGAGRNRVTAGSELLTGSTAESTSNVLSAVNGVLIVNGAPAAFVTGASIKIDGKAASMGSVLGSNITPDIQRGRISVTGQFTAFYQDGVLSAAYTAGQNMNFVIVLTDSQLKDANFISFNIPSIQLTSDTKDDGEKAIIKTYAFTGEFNGAGGTGTSTDQTIISIQDSLA